MSVYIETSNESLFKYGEELCGDKVEIVRKGDFTTCLLYTSISAVVLKTTRNSRLCRSVARREGASRKSISIYRLILIRLKKLAQ